MNECRGNRRPLLMAGLAAVVLAAVAVASPKPTHGFPRLWVLQGGWYHQLNDTEQKLFRDDPAVILGAVPATHRPITAFAFPAIRQDLDGFGTMQTVLYDPEAWDATPIEERRDPITAVRRFAKLAREQGLRLIVTPHPNLVQVPGAVCGQRPGEKRDAAFLRCGILAEAAKVADVVEVQAQDLQQTPGKYRLFVEAGARQARAANPDVKVISGLALRRGWSAASAFAAWSAVRDVVDGFYLSIGANERVPEARRFMNLVLAQEDT